MVSAAELKRRWHQPERLRLTREVRTWLMGQGPRPDGLDEVDGRVDLRGVPLSGSPFTLGDSDDPAAGVTWSSLDLRNAQIDAPRFFGSTVEDCLFDSASLLDLRAWGTEFRDCSFRRADLRSAGLGGGGEWQGRRTAWRRVAFDLANLKESAFIGAVLERCTFQKTSRLLRIVDCEVVDCTFSGTLDSLIVDGRGHQSPVSPQAFSADFSAASFDDVGIRGYVLDRTTLPGQPDVLVVHRFPETARRALDRLTAGATTEAQRQAIGMLELWLKAPGSEEADYCLTLDDSPASRALAEAFAVAGS